MLTKAMNSLQYQGKQMFYANFNIQFDCKLLLTKKLNLFKEFK